MAHTAFETHTDTFIDIEEPKLYRVCLLNDSYTSMDFVTMILMEVFDKAADEAEMLTLKIHKEGKAYVGIYTYDIAELKSQIVTQRAKEHQYPLRVITEEMPS
ncbi:ATP-dependent Clp protease adaptor ClpS [Helicobacter marmotae]|uniref:ATP-dependent Clp protease adapter protein ClpS n=1 Tax=Helicobacter marmotae TaxID=152490 RepID=A0A3D8I4P7_9HELI|nr:ATP-dependent Clp protease adaptor ClpS [Helicobacter marmotae]RDU60109.1 ATP-dependent Clp protease adaptor ClpS [Helicobacter marmotae]